MQSSMIPLKNYRRYPLAEMQKRATDFYRDLDRRRSIRDFADTPVPQELIEQCLFAADTAPSGANLHPWQFVVVSDPDIKREIRILAEHEEREFYDKRAPPEWLEALAPLGTDANKPFLETAPYLIVVFAQVHGLDASGGIVKHYYVNESVGIATGMLITALHHSGLVSLTHTPSPMKFLNEHLARPPNERPFLILVTGFPGSNARVPDLHRRSLKEIATFI